MRLEFENKLTGFIRANGLFAAGDRVLLAVSGGADSIAMMAALHGLTRRGVLDVELLCAHINHGLRGPDADADQRFVAESAEALGLPVHTRSVDVRRFARDRRLSIETAARELRIDGLLEIAAQSACDCVATAHQMNDNAETVLQRLARGTGLRGLAGIWPARLFAGRTRFVRPLLCVTRSEVLEYLHLQNLTWRRDHTNADCTFRRNYIRHRLMPALQAECDGSLVEQLSSLANSAHRLHEIVSARAESLWPRLARVGADAVEIDPGALESQSQPLRVEILRRALAAVGSGERKLTRRHYERVLQLALRDDPDAKIQLPGRVVVRREGRKLIFEKGREESSAPTAGPDSATIRIPGTTTFAGCIVTAEIVRDAQSRFESFKRRKTPCVEWFDLDCLKLPLRIRYRRTGDRFRPLGLDAEKKLGKFLTAAKPPREMRENILVVADSEKIIWVWPIRMCEQGKVTDAAQRILQLRIETAKK